MARTEPPEPIQPVVMPDDILRARKVVNEVYIDPKVEQYIVDVVFATREPEKVGLSDLKNLIAYGASPRATIYLNLAARAHAFLNQRGYTTPEDVKTVAYDVMRHRIILTYEAEAEEIQPEEIIRKVLNAVPVP
ncbi:MAG: MoxR family ATPase [Chloroherpetonaceae bacterium]|nr:MoxR family ATPase [Chloroherpetonaceae bacterium]